MGEPFGKASRRTFFRINTFVSFPYRSSPKMNSSVSHKTLINRHSKPWRAGCPGLFLQRAGKISAFFLILIFLVPIFSHAQPMGMKPWKKESRCGRASDLNLTPEQAKGLDLLQQTYLQETQLLRAQLITRRLELRELLTNPSLKADPIRTKYVEVAETQSKLEEKAIEYLLKVRGLLTNDQLKFWCPEEEFPPHQRMMPGHRPMRRMNPMRALPPEE